MIYAGDEIKLSRTVMRVPESEKWNACGSISTDGKKNSSAM